MSKGRIAWRTICLCALAGMALGGYAKLRWGWASGLSILGPFSAITLIVLLRNGVRERLLGEDAGAAIGNGADGPQAQ
jgi:hypothetical protein